MEWQPASKALLRRLLQDTTIDPATRAMIAVEHNIKIPDDIRIEDLPKDLRPFLGELKETRGDLQVSAQDKKMIQIRQDFNEHPDTKAQLLMNLKTQIPLRMRFKKLLVQEGEDSQLGQRLEEGPLVAAVSPMTDTQTLDLQSSFRQHQELALSLAAQYLAAGATVQGQAFLNYAKSLQQDFATVTPDVVVSSFSSGSVFGYQVGPRLKAVVEPRANQASGPADVLDRQTFPALIILGFDSDDIAPRIHVEKHGGTYHMVCYEPVLKFEGVNQWIPVYGPFLGVYGKKVLSESERLALSYELKDRVQTYKGRDDAKTDNDKKDLHKFMVGRVDARADALTAKVLGSSAAVSLPLEVIVRTLAPHIAAAKPDEVTVGKDTPVLLYGSDLNAIDLARITVVQGDGNVVNNSPQLIDSSTLQVTVHANKDLSPLILQLLTTTGDRFYSPPLVVKSAPKPLPLVSVISPDTVTLKVDKAGAAQPLGVRILLVGEGLDQVDLDRLDLAQSKDTASIDRSTADVKPQLLGKTGTIVLNIKVTKASGAIVFNLPIKNQTDSVLSLPLIVKTSEPTATAPARSLAEITSPAKTIRSAPDGTGQVLVSASAKAGSIVLKITGAQIQTALIRGDKPPTISAEVGKWTISESADVDLKLANLDPATPVTISASSANDAEGTPPATVTIPVSPPILPEK